MKKRNGFTLVELLIVIAIMSILTIITVSQFNTARKKARDVSRKSDLNSVSKAIALYYSDYGWFPTEDKLNTKWGQEFSDDGYVYMKVLPKENQGGWPGYCYVVADDQKSYAIFTALENTTDADCKNPGYKHCGNQNYCFSVTSPNVEAGSFQTLNP